MLAGAVFEEVAHALVVEIIARAGGDRAVRRDRSRRGRSVIETTKYLARDPKGLGFPVGRFGLSELYLLAHLADADGGRDSAVLWVDAFHKGFELASGEVWNRL